MDATSWQDPSPRTGSVLLARLCALALAAGLLTGCGGGGTDTAEPGADLGYGAPAPTATPTPSPSTTPAPSPTDDGDQAAEDLVIVIEGFDYELPDTVPPGAEIVVRNLDGVGHTVTADEGGTFDVAVGPGAEVTLTAPSEAGEYAFHCTPHPAMTGTLVVEGEG